MLASMCKVTEGTITTYTAKEGTDDIRLELDLSCLHTGPELTVYRNAVVVDEDESAQYVSAFESFDDFLERALLIETAVENPMVFEENPDEEYVDEYELDFDNLQYDLEG